MRLCQRSGVCARVLATDERSWSNPKRVALLALRSRAGAVQGADRLDENRGRLLEAGIARKLLGRAPYTRRGQMPSYEHFSVKAWPSLMIGLGMELTYQRAGSGSGIGNGIVDGAEAVGEAADDPWDVVTWVKTPSAAEDTAKATEDAARGVEYAVNGAASLMLRIGASAPSRRSDPELSKVSAPSPKTRQSRSRPGSWTRSAFAQRRFPSMSIVAGDTKAIRRPTGSLGSAIKLRAN